MEGGGGRGGGLRFIAETREQRRRAGAGRRRVAPVRREALADHLEDALREEDVVDRRVDAGQHGREEVARLLVPERAPVDRLAEAAALALRAPRAHVGLLEVAARGALRAVVEELALVRHEADEHAGDDDVEHDEIVERDERLRAVFVRIRIRST